MGLFNKVANLFRSERIHNDAADELAFHLESRTRENMARGMTPEDARQAARKQLGNLTYSAEETASADVVAWLEACLRDLRVALRVLRKAPVFGTMAVLSLALGIGANTMVFTVLKHVVLDGLPVPHADQLVIVHNVGVEQGHVSDNGMRSSFSYPLYRDLDAAARPVFTGVGASYGATATLVQAGSSARVYCELVSGNYFQVLNVSPWRGRLLNRSDDVNLNGHPLAVLSYGFWQANFGADEHIVGRTIRLNTFPYVVIGIAPPRFLGINTSDAPDVFVPMMMKKQILPTTAGLLDRLDHWVNVFGRLQPGVTLARAQNQLNAIYPALRDQDIAAMHTPEKSFLQQFKKNKLELSPGGKGYSGLRDTLQQPLRFLTWMVVIVLLITVVNVANLSIARGAAREREMAVRLSVGAGRTALVRQLLIESSLLGLIGGALGVVIAYVATPLLLHKLKSDLSEASVQGHPDGLVLLLTALVSIAAGIAFGLLPALHSARTDVTTALKAEGGTGHTGGRIWLRRVLVGGQIGFSLLLLTGAMLFTTSLWNSQHVDTGMKTDQVLTFKVNPVEAGYSQVRVQSYGEDLRAKLQRVPGVARVALANTPVLEQDDWGRNITVPGHVQPNDQNEVLLNAVSAGFFETLGIRLRMGRTFKDSDMTGKATVVLVNTTFVKHFFGSANPIGAHMQFGSGDNNKNPLLTIIGVVADSRNSDLHVPIQPFVYVPYVATPNLNTLVFYVKTDGNGAGVPEAVRSMVGKIDRSVPIYDLRTMEQLITLDLFAERGLAILSLVFAGLAVVLAVIGLYGVVAYSVSRRRREFGIRMAIGADRFSVLRIVLGETAVLGLVSLLCATPIVLATGRLVRSALYGVEPNDPVICFLAALILFVAAMAAGFVPAASAARTDPYLALRME